MSIFALSAFTHPIRGTDSRLGEWEIRLFYARPANILGQFIDKQLSIQCLLIHREDQVDTEKINYVLISCETAPYELQNEAGLTRKSPSMCMKLDAHRPV